LVGLSEPTEMDEIIELLRGLRADVDALKRGEKVVCSGVTGKGTPCRNGVVAGGGTFCRMHGRESAPPKERRVRVPKQAKPKKIQPEHTHALGETPESPCPLCDTHGDVMDPDLPGASFEGDDLTERLRALLSSE
jgi:hypothetical protein